MSYAGTYGERETCRHGNYWRNCTACIIELQEKNGTRDESGVLHSDNGAGWCVGHLDGGRCTVLVRHCPVLNTPEQLAQNLREDKTVAVSEAKGRVREARTAVSVAERELAKAERTLEALQNG